MNKDNKKQAYKLANKIFECSKYYPDVIAYLVALMKNYNCLEQALKDIKESLILISSDYDTLYNQDIDLVIKLIIDKVDKALGDDK